MTAQQEWWQANPPVEGRLNSVWRSDRTPCFNRVVDTWSPIFTCFLLHIICVCVCIYLYLYYSTSDPSATRIWFPSFLRLESCLFSPPKTTFHQREGVFFLQKKNMAFEVPSRELTYPTVGKGKSSKAFWEGDMLVPGAYLFQGAATWKASHWWVL